jgi:alkylation response protein AidB-like acyl-CoA dehydrogenase
MSIRSLHRESLRTATLGRSPEQEELRQVVRAFLQAKVPESEVRRLMATEDGLDRAAWRRSAQEQLLPGLAIPEEYGGAGFGFGELAVVTEELGRALAYPSFLSTVVITANALLLSGDEAACRQWLPGIAAGETIATVALPGSMSEALPPWPAGEATEGDVLAERSGSGWALTGQAPFVLDGHVADLLLVVARSADGPTLFACEPGSRVERVPLDTLDPTRKQARVSFRRAPALPIGEAGAAYDVLARVMDLGATALAAEQVGGAAYALETAVDYARHREQFGRPIGSFQAIKHKCADMLVELEEARSAAHHAVWAAATLDPSLPVAASVAKVACSEAFSHIAAETVQVHGGIGFTWEHSAHLYFRRAKSDEVLFGDPIRHRARLGELIGLAGGY